MVIVKRKIQRDKLSTFVQISKANQKVGKIKRTALQKSCDALKNRDVLVVVV